MMPRFASRARRSAVRRRFSSRRAHSAVLAGAATDPTSASRTSVSCPTPRKECDAARNGWRSPRPRRSPADSGKKWSWRSPPCEPASTSSRSRFGCCHRRSRSASCKRSTSCCWGAAFTRRAFGVHSTLRRSSKRRTSGAAKDEAGRPSSFGTRRRDASGSGAAFGSIYWPDQSARCGPSSSSSLRAIAALSVAIR
jgi:hypothetical protein